jgi:hypothetical protein
MEITRDDHSTMHSIVERTERARAAFVGVALKGDEGIAKLVMGNTDDDKSGALQGLNGERFIAAATANSEKIVVGPIAGSRCSLITRYVRNQKN